MDNWMAVKTSLYVARLGTVSAAAKALGIHRATVIRHIDELESVVGSKLFQRHTRGYHLTEAGNDLLQVANATEEQFKDLAGRIRGKAREVHGSLIVTSIEIMDAYLLPIIQEFRSRHPETNIELRITDRILKLEYGEAHVAIRAGRKPTHPDNVVLPLLSLKTGLYAHRSYIERHGEFRGIDDIENHSFIGHPDENTRSTFRVWMRNVVPAKNIVFTSNKTSVQRNAVHEGLGIGFLPKKEAEANTDLIEVMPAMRSWVTRFWIATHVDLHRSAKVQAFLRILKKRLRG